MRTRIFPDGQTYPFKLALFAGHCNRCKFIAQEYPCSDCRNLNWTLHSYFQDAGTDMVMAKKLELSMAQGRLEGLRMVEEQLFGGTGSGERGEG